MNRISKLVALITLIVFISCNKEENTTDTNYQSKKTELSHNLTSKSGNTTIEPADYGFYHNEAIKLYNEKYLQGDITKLKNTDAKKVINDLLILMKEKYPNEFDNVDTSEFLTYFDSSTTTGKFDFFDNWNKNKSIYIKNGYVSQKVSFLIDDVIANGTDYLSIINIITTFKNNNELTNSETNSVLVFQSVIENSHNLWNNNNPFSKKNPCTPRTIIADAGTSAIFFYGGPFGVLAGAASSLFVYYSDPSC